VAVWLAERYPESAFVYLFGIALFGGLFVWLIIFITHLRFRRIWQSGDGGPLPVRMPFYPYSSVLGALLLAAILATTWWVEGMRPALAYGVPWLVLLSLIYVVSSRRRSSE